MQSLVCIFLSWLTCGWGLPGSLWVLFPAPHTSVLRFPVDLVPFLPPLKPGLQGRAEQSFQFCNNKRVALPPPQGWSAPQILPFRSPLPHSKISGNPLLLTVCCLVRTDWDFSPLRCGLGEKCGGAALVSVVCDQGQDPGNSWSCARLGERFFPQSVLALPGLPREWAQL